MSHSQTALVVQEIGKPLIKTTRPIPTPKDGEILVKVTVAGLNPHDMKSRNSGLFIQNSLPAVLALDVAGVVAQVGPNVTNFQEGDRVFGQGSPANSDSQGLQEYAILQAKFAAHPAPGFTDAQMASLPTNLVTSLVALFDNSALDIPAPWTPGASGFDYKSTSLLIVGGGSNTGKFAVQLAALAGIGQIIVVAGAKNDAELRSFGATHIIDRTAPPQEIVAQIRTITRDDLLYAYDTINLPEDQFLGVDALSTTKKGILARLLPMGPVDESRLTFSKVAGFETRNVFGVSTVRQGTAAPFWERVTQLVEAGKIQPLSYQTVSGLDVDRVDGKLCEYASGRLTGQVQVHL